MSLNLIDGLVGEHALFYVLFERFEQQLAEATELETVRAAADLLKHAVVAHAAAEEELLFAALTQRGQAPGSMTVMQAEHAEIDQLAGAAAAARELGAARAASEALLMLLREHFRKEEELLFPSCREALDEATLRELGSRWAGQRGL